MNVFRLDQWIVYRDLNRIERGSVRRSLEPRQMDVLVRLAEAGGGVVAKEQLLRDVWDDRFVVEHVVPKTISSLRAALEESARRPRIIQTVNGRGYRLACAVSEGAGQDARMTAPPRRAPLRAAGVGVFGLVAMLLGARYGPEILRPPPLPEKIHVRTEIRIEPDWSFDFGPADGAIEPAHATGSDDRNAAAAGSPGGSGDG